MKTRVLLCSHRVAFGELLEQALRSAAGVTSVHRTTNGRDALAHAREGKADVALLDPSHPAENMFDIARTMKRAKPRMRVMFMADSVPAGWIFRALALDADGFLGPCATYADYVRAIRSAQAGHKFFSPSAQGVVTDLATGRGPVPSLSERELSVLRLICEGLSTKEIARTLTLQPKTIDSIRARLMEKTHTARATELVRFACDERFVDPRPHADRAPAGTRH